MNQLRPEIVEQILFESENIALSSILGYHQTAKQIIQKWPQRKIISRRSNNDLQTLELLYQDTTTTTTTTHCNIYTDNINEHFEFLKWLRYNNTRKGCTAYQIDFSAFNGHLEIIKWLHQNTQEECTKWAMNYASENGHLEVVKWLHENRTEGCTTQAIKWATYNGHLEIVKFLDENRTCATLPMNWLVSSGLLEIV